MEKFLDEMFYADTCLLNGMKHPEFTPMPDAEKLNIKYFNLKPKHPRRLESKNVC